MPPWTDSSKYRLLLAVIECTNVDKLPDWADVASKVGPEFTAEAVR